MKLPVVGAWLMAALLLLPAIGCRSLVEEHMGDAHNENKSRMIANPAAGKELTVVDGIDGGTGENVMQNYHRQQVGPQKAIPSVIGSGIGAQ